MEAIRVDRRVNDFGRTSVGATNALGNDFGICDEVIGLAGSILVPYFEAANEHGEQGAFAEAEGFALRIFVEAPDPAHRSVAVADMNGIAPGLHPLGVARGTGKHEIVRGKVEIADGEGIEEEIQAIVTFDA